MFNKRMMIEEGDIGILFSEVLAGQKEKTVDFDGNDIEVDFWEQMVEEELVEYKSKEECLKEFNDMIFKDRGYADDGSNDEYLNQVRSYIKLITEKEEGNSGKWFVGSNGEYVVFVGFEFESESDEEVVLDNEEL